MRERTGKGVRIETNMIAASMAFVEFWLVDYLLTKTVPDTERKSAWQPVVRLSLRRRQVGCDPHVLTGKILDRARCCGRNTRSRYGSALQHASRAHGKLPGAAR